MPSSTHRTPARKFSHSWYDRSGELHYIGDMDPYGHRVAMCHHGCMNYDPKQKRYLIDTGYMTYAFAPQNFDKAIRLIIVVRNLDGFVVDLNGFPYSGLKVWTPGKLSTMGGFVPVLHIRGL